MEDQDFNLGQQIAELRGLVVEGFKGVHKRQDTTNGRLQKAEDDINLLKEKGAYGDGTKKGSQMTWGNIIAIVGVTGTVVGVVSTVASRVIIK